MPTQPRSHLLEAPEDIRRLIYEAYVTYPGGLNYEYDSGKLLDDQNAPVDMALIRTCKLIASEMEGLHLRCNTIQFKTCYTNIQRHKDRAWRDGLHLLKEIRLYMLASAYSSLIATDALAVISSRYPYFHRRFSLIMTGMGSGHSVYARLFRQSGLALFLTPMLEQDRQAVNFILRLASTTGDLFRAEAKTYLRRHVDFFKQSLAQHPDFLPFRTMDIFRHQMTTLDLDHLDPVAVANFEDRPWIVPSDDDIVELWSVLGGSPIPRKEKWAIPAEGRVSAAFCAVRFLQSSSKWTLSHIRHMSIVEDRFALHEQHFHGLIPFCVANPNIRITRRLFLWRNLYGRSGSDFFKSAVCIILATEARLFEFGMPKESYSVIFDPEEAPDQATKLFQRYVFRSIAWSRAMLEWERERLPRLPDLLGCCWEDHLDLIERTIADMAADKGPIRCDFACRRLCDPKIALEVIRQHPPDAGSGPNSLRKKFNFHSLDATHLLPCHFKLSPPLPSIDDLRRDDDPWPVRNELEAGIRDARDEYPESIWGQWVTPHASDNEGDASDNESDGSFDESEFEAWTQRLEADNDDDPLFRDYYTDAHDA